MAATASPVDAAAEGEAVPAAAASPKDLLLPVAQGMGGGAALWWNESESTQKIYVDRQFFVSFEAQVAALRDSKTVYIGNLSFYTTEAQIYELCSKLGPVERVFMGLNRNTKTPCGFCFVQHYTAEAALETVARVTGLVLDDRILRAELDFGFRQGRQFGRGQSGGQVRDDRRFVYDSARSSSSSRPVVGEEDREKVEQRKRRFAATVDADASDQQQQQQEHSANAPPPPPRDEEETGGGGSASKRRRRDDEDEDEEDD